MKTILGCALVTCALSLSALAQVPDSLSFQGCLRDSSGDPVPDNTYSVVFSLYASPIADTEQWSEQQVVSTIGCVFDTYLGKTVTLEDVPFDKSLWLGINVETQGEMVRTPLSSVPYALGLRGLRVYPSASPGYAPSLVGGHPRNSVTGGARSATISGGGYYGFEGLWNNMVTGDHGTIGGGYYNRAALEATVAGGTGNHADGARATIGGGWDNAAGFVATVPGGMSNTAGGDYSFAAGRRATVRSGHHGTFVWADHEDADFESTGEDQFLIRAAGGVGIGTNGPEEPLHVVDPLGGSILMLGDDNFGGPNGVVFRDDAPDDGMRMYWRTSTNLFRLERNSDGHEVFTYSRPDSSFNFNSANHDNTPLASRHVVHIENSYPGEDGDVLALSIAAQHAGTDNNFITFFNAHSSEAISSVKSNAAGDGITIETSSGDYAESLPLLHDGESIEPGDIVGVFAGQISQMTAGAQRLMVVTDRPSVLGNVPPIDRKQTYRAVAFLGQVEVKVREPVEPGDYIVPSGHNDGVGTAITPSDPTAELASLVVGRAWSESAGTGISRVLVQVGLDRADVLAELLVQQEEKLAKLLQRIERLEHRIVGPPGL